MDKIEFEAKDEWLEARKSCLTGTTVGRHIGIESPYKPQIEEQMAKNPAINFGNSCEESILTIFRNLPSISKQTLVQITVKPTLWYSSTDSRVAGSFDGMAFENGKQGFVECKSTSAGVYNLRGRVIPDITWLQIIHYFSLDDNLEFCYLVVCDYPKWGDGGAKIDWLRISRDEIADSIANLRGWHKHILAEKK